MRLYVFVVYITHTGLPILLCQTNQNNFYVKNLLKMKITFTNFFLSAILMAFLTNFTTDLRAEEFNAGSNITLAPNNVSGRVYNDANRNVRFDAGEAFTSGTPVSLYVHLVSTAGVVITSATVAGDGTYTLVAPTAAPYTLRLSTTQYANGYNGAIDVTPPTGWVTTGENANGSNSLGGDGEPNGSMLINVGTSDLIQRNFGITCKSAGTSGGFIICGNETAVIPLSVFIQGADEGGTWTQLTGTGITFNALAGTIQLTASATTSTYRYDIAATTSCAASSSIATVTVSPIPVTTQSFTICEGDSVCVFNPQGTGRLIMPQERVCYKTSGTYRDTLVGATVNGCDSIVVTTITVVPKPNAGADGSITTCSNNTSPIDLFSIITGEQSGGVWSRLTGTGGTFNAAAGNYAPEVGATNSIFRYIVTGSSPCGNDTSFVTVNLTTCIAISGTVFNDANGNTIINAGENGTTSGTNLYVYLVNSSGVVIDSAKVNANGTYTLDAVASQNYTIELSTIQYPIGTNTITTPISNTPPAGWSNTGENNSGNVGASDGTPDGVIAVTTGTGNLSNVNFGLQRPPVADPKSYTVGTSAFSNGTPAGFIPVPGYQYIPMNSPALTGYPTGGSLSGSDAEDCASSSSCNTGTGTTFTINTINLNTVLYYDYGGGRGVERIDVSGDPVSIPNFNANNMVIFGQEGSGNSVNPVGFTYTITDNAGVVSSPVNYSIVTSFPLPVELTSFNIKNVNNQILLDWVTAAEQNNKGFEIQHSKDGANWSKIGFVNSRASNGNSTVILEYTFIDKAPLNGTNYYRLQQTDFDGKYEFSAVRSIKLNQASAIKAYPNPASENITVDGLNGGERVYIINSVGQNLHIVKATGKVCTINVKNLNAGILFIKVVDESGVVTSQIKLLKK